MAESNAAEALDLLLGNHPTAWTILRHLSARSLTESERKDLEDELAHLVKQRDPGLELSEIHAAVRAKAMGAA